MIPIWNRLVVVERYPPRPSSEVGFVPPIVGAHLVTREQEPILVTNTKGVLVQTRILPDGHARFAFFKCPLSQEGTLLSAFYSWLVENSARPLATSVPEALAAYPKGRSLVLSEDLIGEVLGPRHYPPRQVEALMKLQGYLAMVDGRQVLMGALPPRSALLLSEPLALGVYTRVGDYMGLQLYNVQDNALAIRVA